MGKADNESGAPYRTYSLTETYTEYRISSSRSVTPSIFLDPFWLTYDLQSNEDRRYGFLLHDRPQLYNSLGFRAR